MFISESDRISKLSDYATLIMGWWMHEETASLETRREVPRRAGRQSGWPLRAPGEPALISTSGQSIDKRFTQHVRKSGANDLNARLMK